MTSDRKRKGRIPSEEETFNVATTRSTVREKEAMSGIIEFHLASQKYMREISNLITMILDVEH